MAQFRTLVDMIEQSCRRYGERPALGTRKDGQWHWTTYRELHDRIARARGGLHALGVQPTDRIAIIADNREEWVVVAFAAYGLGAQVVPMYQAQRASDWSYIMADCGASVVFTATPKIAETVREIARDVKSIQYVLCFEGSADDPNSYAHLLQHEPYPSHEPSPSGVAGFVYTSGTTGKPKGVLLSHANIVSNINSVHSIFTFDPDDRSLSFLPWAHSFGQCEQYMLLSMGCSIAINDELPRLVENMSEVQPSVLMAVPRIFNKLYAGVHHQMSEKPGFVRHLFEDGLEIKSEASHGQPLSWTKRAELALTDKLVFAKVRDKFGGRLKYAISASAALSPKIAEFVDALGIPVMEGYGLTETSPVVAVNRPGQIKIGSVGQPIPGVRVVIDKSVTGDPVEGEIVVYGPNVMLGYHKLPGETEQAMTHDGGLRTGDLGRMDEDGYLYVTGRIKEQYKLENGKYVMPAPLEEQIKLSPLITNVLLYGDNRPYNVALVVPNVDELRRVAAEQQITLEEGDISKSPSARAIIQRELDERGRDFRGFERPRKSVLLAEDFTTENGLLTPTLKVRRALVVARYKAELEALYAEDEERTSEEAAAPPP